MGKVPANNKLLILGGVLLIVVVAAVVLGILPRLQQAADLQSQIDTENTNLVTAQTLLARRQSAKANSAASEVELMDIANAIPDSPQLPTVIIELQDVANAAGVTLLQISPSDLDEGDAANEGGTPAYSVLPIDLMVRGQWVDILDFVGSVDDLDRGLRVVSVTFTYVEDNPDTAKEGDSCIDADIGVEVYVMAAATTASTTSD